MNNMKKIMNEKLFISKSNPVKIRAYDYERFTFPWHFHSEYELMYVKKGSGQCFAGDNIINYYGNDILFFGTNLPHQMRSDDFYRTGNKNKRVKGIVLQFEKDFMDYSMENYPQFLSVKKLLNDSSRGVYFSSSLASELGIYLKRALKYTGLKQILSILLLLDEMSKCKKKQYIASPNYYLSLPALANSRIEKIISFINTNYTHSISLKEVASMAAMNESAFCRFFRENTGKTFLQYIMDIRVGYACKLLTLKNLNIYQIGSECGFNSISHFNRVFRRCMNCTPTSYRDNALNESV